MVSTVVRKKQRFVLQGFDPLSKLIALVCATALVMHWDNPLPLGIMLILLSLAGGLLAGMQWRTLRQRMTFITGFSIPLFILTAIAAPGGQVLWSLGPLTLTTGGLYHGGATALRLICLFLSSLIYIISTDPGDFVIVVVQKLKVPYRLAFGVSIALTFLPLLEAEGKVAAAAREIRGRLPERGLNGRLRRSGSQLVAVFTAAIRRVQMTAGAMESKGFGAYSDRTFVREVLVTGKGITLILISIIATAFIWILTS